MSVCLERRGGLKVVVSPVVPVRGIPSIRTFISFARGLSIWGRDLVSIVGSAEFSGEGERDLAPRSGV